MENNILLSEFDDNSEAVINPGDVIEKIPMIPRVAVTCFSEILFNRILSISKHRVIGRLSNTNGKKEIYDAYSENTKELKKIVKELRLTLKYATQINEMDISSIKTILFNIIRNQKESLKLIAKKLNYNEWQEINHSRNIGGK